MSMGRQEAFEIFKRDYSGNDELEDQKRYLKKNYSEAKLLGEQINTTRTKLSEQFLIHFSNEFFNKVFNQKDHLKYKSEHLYAKLEENNALDDEKQNAEYESIRKTMEYEKEK